MDYREILKRIRDKGETVLVVGLGISGIETARFLRRAQISCVAVERASEEDYRLSSKFKELVDPLRVAGAELCFGVDGERVTKHLSGVSLCVLSPGVSLESSICGALRRHKVPMISELELGIELLKVPAIVVTGSNGKSTTVSLIHAMLLAGGMKSTLCGNVGIPVIADVSAEVLEDKSPEPDSWLVVEASSYQLETCTVLKPKVAMLLNISENHLERHGTLERYLRIKAGVFERQDTSDLAVLSADDKNLAMIRKLIKAEICYFGAGAAGTASRTSVVNYDRFKKQDEIVLTVGGSKEVYSPSNSRLRGRHNRQNIAAAILAARYCGVPISSVERAIDDFIPLEHRIEACREVGGVLYINDSKSTTVAAAVAAFQSTVDEYPDRKITVMFGGLSKAGSWEPLMNTLRERGERINSIICFGKDGPLIARNCKGYSLPCDIATNLAEAVQAASSRSKEGDIVLLTPGCASFDEFSDFEERGNVFKSLVAGI